MSTKYMSLSLIVQPQVLGAGVVRAADLEGGTVRYRYRARGELS